MFGIPDARFGEELCAWIKVCGAGVSLSADEAQVSSAAIQIAHSKAHRGAYLLVDEFPMTVTGKMQKFIMRERMTAELGGAGNGDGIACQHPKFSPSPCGRGLGGGPGVAREVLMRSRYQPSQPPPTREEGTVHVVRYGSCPVSRDTSDVAAFSRIASASWCCTDLCLHRSFPGSETPAAPSAPILRSPSQRFGRATADQILPRTPRSTPPPAGDRSRTVLRISHLDYRPECIPWASSPPLYHGRRI